MGRTAANSTAPETKNISSGIIPQKARGKHEGAMKAIKCLGALELFEKYKEDKEHEEN